MKGSEKLLKPLYFLLKLELKTVPVCVCNNSIVEKGRVFSSGSVREIIPSVLSQDGRVATSTEHLFTAKMETDTNRNNDKSVFKKMNYTNL